MMHALQNSLKNRFFEEAASNQATYSCLPGKIEQRDEALRTEMASLIEDAVKRYCEENLPGMIREQLAQMSQLPAQVPQQ